MNIWTQVPKFRLLILHLITEHEKTFYFQKPKLLSILSKLEMPVCSQHLWKSDNLHVRGLCADVLRRIQQDNYKPNKNPKQAKNKIGNQTIAFGTAWKCENTFVFFPHKLMLFTFICDSQSLIKLHNKQYI